MKTFQAAYSNGEFSESLPLELDSSETLIFAFFKSDQSEIPVWQKLKNSFPKSKIMGCSGAGEIKQNEVIDDQVIITWVKFEKTELKQSFSSLSQLPDSQMAGSHLASDLKSDQLKAIFVLSDGLNVNGTALVKGMRDVLGDHVVIFGGLAGDGTSFKQTQVIVEGKPVTNCI